MTDFLVGGGITEHTKEEFETTIKGLVDVVDFVHVDFADGVFAPNILVGLSELEALNTFGKQVEAHLMVQDPLVLLEQCVQKNISRVLIHQSSLPNTSNDAFMMVLNYAKSINLEVGLVLESGAEMPGDNILSKVDLVQVMTVKLGFAGGQFIQEQLEVVRQLSNRGVACGIQVDGGVNDKTIDQIKAAGATRVVCTSWFRGGNLREKFELLK